MGFQAEAYLHCDGCGKDETVELKKDESTDAAIDASLGEWNWAGTLLDRLLCEECYEKEEG